MSGAESGGSHLHSISPRGDRAMLIETMNTMKDILETSITRAVRTRKKRCENESSSRTLNSVV